MKEEQNKYEFTGETMEFEGHKIQRIRYICDFGITTKGELGGWIESEHNLSHYGSCRVLHEAKIFGNAQVKDASLVANNAIVKDNAQVRGQTFITNDAIIGGDSILSGEAFVGGESKVFFYAQALDENDDELLCQPNISGYSYITGSSIIEATGSIEDSELHNVSLFGMLKMKDER